MQSRFVIGIGSQRAGSTLLHRVLDASTSVFMHPLKELHYFDTLYGYRSPDALKEYSWRQLSREINSIVSAKNFNFINDTYRCYLRSNKLLFAMDIEKIDYVDLFRPNLRHSSLLGEVTPEYMLMGDESIAKMRETIGRDAAIVLICREPVARVLSALKLMNSYNGLSMDNAAAESWLQRMMDDETDWLRAQDGYNSYEQVIERYSKAFPHFATIAYDELLETPRLVAARLSSCLDIEIDLGEFENGLKTIVNDLGSDFSVSAELRDRLVERYKSSRNFIESYFHRELHR